MSIFRGIISLAQSGAKAIQGATKAVTPIGTRSYGAGATVGRTATSVKAGTTAISTGRISNAGIKAGVGIGATGAGIGVLGLGTQQLIEPLTQITNPIDSLLGKGTGWTLIIGAVILLIIGVLFKR